MSYQIGTLFFRFRMLITFTHLYIPCFVKFVTFGRNQQNQTKDPKTKYYFILFFLLLQVLVVGYVILRLKKM